MSHDNLSPETLSTIAASDQLVTSLLNQGDLPFIPEPEDRFDVMSDRALLLHIARDMEHVRTLAAEAAAQVEPLLKSPALKMFTKFL